ncbi:hypothetical protein V2J09_015431 [Rumex salicifolius]
MACFHHHNNQSATCCCSNHYNTPPPPPLPPPAIDPILLQSVVSQLLQNPQTAHLFSTASTAAFTAVSTPSDFHPSSSQYLQHRIQKRPKQKQPQPHRQPFEDQFQDQYSDLASLLQRIDVLESSLHRFSSGTTSSLRHVAARTIQIRFRAHLARRSRALSELKELASIKSALNVLKSSLSLQKRIDFFSLSHEALDLISRLEIIQSGDQMVRDSKNSIRREIGRFLELIDEICAKRNTVSVKMVKHIRMARNDDKSRVSYAGRDSSGAYHRDKPSKQPNKDSYEKREIDKLRERVERIQNISKGLINEGDSMDSDDGNVSRAYHGGKSSKQRNVDSNKKKLIDDLRERVERIQHISKGLKDEEDSADSDDGNEAIHSKIYSDGHRRGEVTGQHRSPAEKHVWFADGNSTRVHNIHEDREIPMKRVSCNAERREESVDNQHDEDGEMESDIEENDAESAEGHEFEDEEQNVSLESSSQGSEGEEAQRKNFTHEKDTKVKPSRSCQDEMLILSAPSPVKMEGRAGFTKNN